MTIVMIGAFLVICGVIVLASKAIWGGRLSSMKPRSAPDSDTLEPRAVTNTFDPLANWPGFALFALGSAMLLIGAFAS